jgi:thiol-disulfide isomerase/thioredoxin
MQAATLPRHSPELAIETNSGKQLLLSSYKGKVVVAIFILTYCPHCQKTVEHLSKLQKEMGPRGLQVVASAIEEMASSAVPEFIRRYQPPFPVGYNDRNTALEYLQHPFGARLLMPQIVFIDRTFTIRAQYPGDDKFFGDDQEKNLREQIEKLLRESPTAGATGLKKGTEAPKGAGKKKAS